MKSPQTRRRLGNKKVVTSVLGDAQFQHESKGKRSTLSALPTFLHDKMDSLTTVDQDLYRLAFAQFMKEIAWLEAPEQLGRRVLCDKDLEKVDPEVKYLEINVIDTYWRAKQEETVGRKR